MLQSKEADNAGLASPLIITVIEQDNIEAVKEFNKAKLGSVDKDLA